MNRAVVLLSGGMDSSTLLYYVSKKLDIDEIYSLSFSYGQKHSKELDMARQQAEAANVTEHREIDISCYGDLTKGGSALTDDSIDVPDLVDIAEQDRVQAITYVPNRNMTFLSLAAAYAESIGIQDLFYGAQAQDEYGYWDCTSDFIEKVNNVFGLNRVKPVMVHAPFVNMSKAEVLELGIGLGVNYDNTWTCYRGGDKPCGLCPSCVERQQAFNKVNKG